MTVRYSNITLWSSQRDVVAHYLATHKRAAYLSPIEHGAFVVLDRDGHETAPVHFELAQEFSKQLACAAFVVTDYGDDVLVYYLIANGEILDQYVSDPLYFDDPDDPGRRGNAALLVRTLGPHADVRAVESELSRVADPDEGPKRHARLVELLGLPRAAIMGGFIDMYRNKFPAGYAADDFVGVAIDDVGDMVDFEEHRAFLREMNAEFESDRWKLPTDDPDGWLQSPPDVERWRQPPSDEDAWRGADGANDPQ